MCDDDAKVFARPLWIRVRAVGAEELMDYVTNRRILSNGTAQVEMAEARQKNFDFMHGICHAKLPELLPVRRASVLRRDRMSVGDIWSGSGVSFVYAPRPF
jgi:hypothetical protein